MRIFGRVSSFFYYMLSVNVFVNVWNYTVLFGFYK
nr:MAG TPA: hypothetical protein [Crassvirales sp.]